MANECALLPKGKYNRTNSKLAAGHWGVFKYHRDFERIEE